MERGEPYAPAERVVCADPQINGNYQDRDDEYTQIRLELGVPEQPPNFSGEQAIEENEVHPGQDHENGYHDVDIRRIVVTDAGVFRRESPRSEGAERMGQRVEETHPAEHQQGGLGRRKPQIDEPEDLRGLRDLGFELVEGRTGRFGLHERDSADPEEGENGDCEDHDPHSAQPVGQRSPEQHREWKVLDIGEDGSSGGRESGHSLEERVGVTRYNPRQIERQRSDQAGDYPAQRYEKKTVAVGERALLPPGEEHDDEREHYGEKHGLDEVPYHIHLVEEQGDNNGENQKRRDDEEQYCHDPEYECEVHIQPVKIFSILVASSLCMMIIT